MEGTQPALGEATDRVFMRTDSKKKEGSVGALTRGLIDRTAYYQHGIVMALVPFVNTELHGIDKAVKRTDSKQLRVCEEADEAAGAEDDSIEARPSDEDQYF